MVKGLEPVDAGVASGTEGDQETALVDARTTMMNGEFTLSPTGATAAAVAVEDGLPLAGKAAAGMGTPPVTRRAQAGVKEAGLPAGAEKPGLIHGVRGDGHTPRSRGQTRRAFTGRGKHSKAA